MWEWVASAFAVAPPATQSRRRVRCVRGGSTCPAKSASKSASSWIAWLFKRYRELTTEAQADEWFGILPKEGQWQNTTKYDRTARTVTFPKSIST